MQRQAVEMVSGKVRGKAETSGKGRGKARTWRSSFASRDRCWQSPRPDPCDSTGVRQSRNGEDLGVQRPATTH